MIEATSSSATSSLSPKDWNLKALKHEVNKQYLKSIKKLTKLHERMEELKETKVSPGEHEKAAVSNDDPSEEKKEEETIEDKVQKLEKDLEFMRSRSEKLREIDEGLASIKNPKDSRLLLFVPIIEELQISLKTVTREPTQKQSASSSSSPQYTPRKPYFIYRSSDGIEIYVGRRAEDNDELSCNSLHRDDNEWWLHVANFAGSHVVIKSTDDRLPFNYRSTILDAAVLAAMNSKASSHSKVTVSLTRCKNVSKPSGAKPGLVQLRGDIRSVTVDLKNEKFRLERLEKIG